MIERIPPTLTMHVHWCSSPTARWPGHTWDCAMAACATSPLAPMAEKVCPLHGHQ